MLEHIRTHKAKKKFILEQEIVVKPPHLVILLISRKHLETRTKTRVNNERHSNLHALHD